MDAELYPLSQPYISPPDRWGYRFDMQSAIPRAEYLVRYEIKNHLGVVQMTQDSIWTREAAALTGYVVDTDYPFGVKGTGSATVSLIIYLDDEIILTKEHIVSFAAGGVGISNPIQEIQQIDVKKGLK